MKITSKINPTLTDQLADLVRQLETGVLPTDAKEIYTGRNRIYVLNIGDLTVSIKAFRRPGSLNGFVYTNLRKSKARRSYEYAEELLRRDIPTPQPLAWIERKSGGRLRESYYVCEQSHYPENLRHWETWAPEKRDEVLHQYAKFMVRLHKAGVQHHDLSPGNILWHKDGVIRFHVIDLNRMTLRDKPLTLPEAFGNFRNINLVEEETARLGAMYGEVAGLDPDKSAEMALKALRADQKKKKRRKKLKKLLRG